MSGRGASHALLAAALACAMQAGTAAAKSSAPIIDAVVAPTAAVLSETSFQLAVATVIPFAAGVHVFELTVLGGDAPSFPARVVVEASAPGVSVPVAVAVAPATVRVTVGARSARVQNADPAYRVDGTNVFSHPAGAGVTLARSYDRKDPALSPGPNGAILDAGGVAQTGAGDGNPTNDLVLDGGQIRCLTCHSVHHADSSAAAADVH